LRLSRDGPTDAGLVRDKASVLGATINGTPLTTQYENHKNYSRQNFSYKSVAIST
jgi:hypothetical protein